MIELERHIEILLLDNDCVIVPGLGGFVAHHVEARYDERDGVFLPPLRTLGFNSKLDMNDSLLVQSYVDAYDISYPEALNRIAEDVDELKLSLEKDGFYEMNDIGVLTLNSDGNYEFEPCESGILTPDLYGLSGYEIDCTDKADVVKLSSVAEKSVAQPKSTLGGNASNDATDEVGHDTPFISPALVKHLESTTKAPERIISIKVSWLRNMLAAACAIIAFFFLSTPINTNVYKCGKEISGVNGSLLYNLIPCGGETQQIMYGNTKAAKKSVALNLTQNVNTEAHPVKENTSLETCVKSDYFCIVLACRITRSNADEYVRTLQEKGMKDVRVLDVKGAPLKVVLGEYSTEKQAFMELEKLKKDEMFEESWIYHVK